MSPEEEWQAAVNRARAPRVRDGLFALRIYLFSVPVAARLSNEVHWLVALVAWLLLPSCCRTKRLNQRAGRV